MKIFFIVTTSQMQTGFYVHSKYDQLPHMYHFNTQKQAIEVANDLNEQANKEYSEKITLTENKAFSTGVKKFITNYDSI